MRSRGRLRPRRRSTAGRRVASGAMTDDTEPRAPARGASTPAAPAAAAASASCPGAGWSTRSARSRSCPPTRSRRSTGRRCGSWPRSGCEVLGDRALDAFAAAGATVDRATRRVRLDPAQVEELVALAPARVPAARPEPGAGRPVRRREPRVRRGRRAGLRQRPRPRPASRATSPTSVDYVRLIGALDVIHQEGGGPLEPTDLPVETRHLDMYRTFATELDKTWQCLGFGASAGRRRAGGRVPHPRRATATTLVARAVADDDHQHELAAPPRRPDGRRADRDGAARPAGRRHAVHAGRRDEPGLAGRRDRPAERRGAVPGRARPDRPAGRADGLRRVHLERRHADRVAGLRHARVGQGAVRAAARWRGATGCRGGRRTRPRRTSSMPRRPTRPRWPCGAR